MCTLSWSYDRKNGYQVFFNRDEQKSRLSALPPQQETIDGVHCLLPLDPVGGGSWISVNEFGVTVCLLNYYQGETPNGTLVSRGLIIKALASSQNVQEAVHRLHQLNLARSAPFTLVPFDRQKQKEEKDIWVWDGIQLRCHVSSVPVVSAAKFFDEAKAYRHHLFAHFKKNLPEHEIGPHFHRSFNPECPHLSPVMYREDARTVSITSVTVNKAQQQMTYQSIDKEQNVEFVETHHCSSHKEYNNEEDICFNRDDVKFSSTG